jgi:spermidine/putrescine ABC transporter ATP-binding subunit
MTQKTPIISIRNVSKKFGNTVAVDNVNLDIQPGEFFALLGPSGCGKTTLLRMIAGFEVPSEGQILIDGQDMSYVPPNKRPINMVFQSYAVFPHMSVADNVAYGLKMDGVPSSERGARVEEALNMVSLGGYGGRMPDQLSGGQRQRVALARALVKRPKVLLLDEPLSALDAKLRESMRFELAQLQVKIGITFIMVTHDQDEALAMADRITVMNRGMLSQTGTPSELYEFPANRFIADFLGGVNLFEGQLTVDEPDHAILDVAELGGKTVYLDHGVSGARDAVVSVGIRPEKLELHKRGGDSLAPPKMEDAPQGYNATGGVIKHISYLGSESVFEVELDSQRRVRVTRPNLTRYDQEDFTWDEPVWVTWHACSPVVLLS